MKKYEKLPRIDLRPELPKKKKLSQLFDLVRNNAAIYDKVIWLVDFDVILGDGQVEKFKEYARRLQNNTRVIIIVNNPCLEFWYLLHFKETGKSFSKCDAVIRELIKSSMLKDYRKSERYYKHGKNDIYGQLKPFQETAIENAKKLGHFEFDAIESAKAEIYKILDMLTER